MSERVRGCVYSRFERTGPKPICWYPDQILEDISKNNLRQIAIKTINMLAADRKIPETSAIVPFPVIDMVGLVKFLEIPAPGERGSAKDCSLTLLFIEEADDVIHKYFDTFEQEIHKCSEILLEMEKSDESEDIEDILKSFYYSFNSKLEDILIPEEKLEILQKALDDVKVLIQEIVESGSATQDELQTALKLSFELNQLNLEETSADDIAKIMTIANELQVKKQMISQQQAKLKKISKKLDKKNLKRLENKLSLIVESFDNYVEKIHHRVNKLGDIGTTMLFFRDFKNQKESEDKIHEISLGLTQQIKFISNFQKLPPMELKKAKISYKALVDSRIKKKYKMVGTHAMILAKLTGVSKEAILKESKDPQIRAELDMLLLDKKPSSKPPKQVVKEKKVKKESKAKKKKKSKAKKKKKSKKKRKK